MSKAPSKSPPKSSPKPESFFPKISVAHDPRGQISVNVTAGGISERRWIVTQMAQGLLAGDYEGDRFWKKDMFWGDNISVYTDKIVRIAYRLADVILAYEDEEEKE